MASCQPLMIKELGGWRTPGMVQRYAHLSTGHQRQAIERRVTRAVTVPRPPRGGAGAAPGQSSMEL